MITHSGIHIQKKDDDVQGTPTLIDFGIHAGRICRFGGAIWEPLLTHLVFVGLMAYRRSGKAIDALWGFMHDGHEIVTGEVPRPFKCDCMRAEQAYLDERIWRCHFSKIQEIPDFELIKRCDVDACDIEATVLNLKTYHEVTLVHGQKHYAKTREAIYADPADITLFGKLLESPFYIGTTDASSNGGWEFSMALLAAKMGDMRGFENRILDWKLFD